MADSKGNKLTLYVDVISPFGYMAYWLTRVCHSHFYYMCLLFIRRNERRNEEEEEHHSPSPIPIPIPIPYHSLTTTCLSLFFQKNPALPSIHLHPNNLHPHPPRRPHVPNQKLSSFNNHQQTRMDRNRTSPDLQIFANSHDADFSGKIPCAHDECATLVVLFVLTTTRTTK